MVRLHFSDTVQFVPPRSARGHTAAMHSRYTPLVLCLLAGCLSGCRSERPSCQPPDLPGPRHGTSDTAAGAMLGARLQQAARDTSCLCRSSCYASILFKNNTFTCHKPYATLVTTVMARWA